MGGAGSEAGLKVRHEPKLGLYLPQKCSRQRLDIANDSTAIDGATLIDHRVTFFSVASDPTRKGNSKEVLSGQTRRAGQHPGRRMFGLVEKVRLDDEHRPGLAGFGSPARVAFDA